MAKVTQDSLRNAIGMVTQDTSLLHRTIRDNIAYGRPDATEAQIRAAAANAQADGFIGQLSDRQGNSGYDTLVGSAASNCQVASASASPLPGSC